MNFNCFCQIQHFFLKKALPQPEVEKALGIIFLYVNLHVIYASISLNPTVYIYSDVYLCDVL